MYLRESKQKRVDGSVVVYLQLAENVWNPEKRRAETRIVCNCGRADDPAVTERLRRLARSILRRCSPQEIVADEPQWRLVCAYPYGPLYALQALWSHFGIDEIIRAQAGSRRLGFDVERALFAMVANRGCAPASKLYCYEQWLKEDVHIAGTEALRLHQLYRAMDFLEANKDSIEREIFFRVADLCNLDVEVIFYDTTSLHFEIDEEDHGSAADDTVRGSRAAGARTYRALRKRGHSKNGRFDAPQIVVGLAVTRDGFPVRHWVFPGNTVDVTTVARVKQELRGWQLTRCVFVGDAGMVSAANFHALAAGGGKYIMCMPVRHGEEVAVHVLSRPGRYQSVTENLQVKEVWVGDGERRRRYVVCFNTQEASRQRAHRSQVLEELAAELDSLRQRGDGVHSKRACALVASARYGRYLKQTGSRLAIDARAVAAAERLDGKFVVHSNDDTLTAADMALGYKQLQRVEQAWRDMKSGLKLRPVFHGAAHRIHAHVVIAVLTLLLERAAEHACADAWRNIRDDRERIQLAQLSSPHGTVWQVTDPTPEATNRLKLLRISAPPPILGRALDTRSFPASPRKCTSRAPFAPVCQQKVSNPGQSPWFLDSCGVVSHKRNHDDGSGTSARRTITCASRGQPIHGWGILRPGTTGSLRVVTGRWHSVVAAVTRPPWCSRRSDPRRDDQLICECEVLKPHSHRSGDKRSNGPRLRLGQDQGMERARTTCASVLGGAVATRGMGRVTVMHRPTGPLHEHDRGLGLARGDG